jgi:hypothetical protein
MQLDWRILLTALGLAFVLEGLPYFLFAERMPKVLSTLSQQPPKALRTLGLAAILVGLAVILFVRG